VKKLLILILFVSSLFAYQNSYNRQQVIKDFNSGNTAKYMVDNLNKLEAKTLVEKKIINSESELKANTTLKEFEEMVQKNLLSIKLSCKVQEPWTATIYEINPKAGIVKCMVAKKGDLYNPIGYYEVNHSAMSMYFNKDLKKAEDLNKNIINLAQNKYDVLYNFKKSIKQTVNSNLSSQYLSMPDMLLSTILTDTDIVDVEAMNDTGKLQLKENFTSKVFDDANDPNSFYQNSELILEDASNIFTIYSKLSELSMYYLMILVVFFGSIGIGGAVLRPVLDRSEGHKNQDKKIPYGAGIFLGILFLFPTGDATLVAKDSTGAITNEYQVMHTKFQEFERKGYYLFSNWASDAASAIIDTEVDSIISKSGVSNKATIVNAYAGKEQYNKLVNFTGAFKKECSVVYDEKSLSMEDFSNDKNNIFPVSENWLFAKVYSRAENPKYYKHTTIGGMVEATKNNMSVKESSKYYPVFSISSCGKNYYKNVSYSSKYEDYKTSYTNSIRPAEQKKIQALKTLIKFQYELQRDWGFLAILGLPVTKMQTEYIGELYTIKNSAVLDKLSEEIEGEDETLHMIMSSIPYMFIPGAGTVYTTIKENSGKLGSSIGGAAGGAASAAASGGLLSVFGGVIGATIGGIVGTVSGGAIGMWAAYISAKTLLSIAPIVGVVILGVLRYIIIIVKIFSFHFASLFMLPIIFAKANSEAISSFSMKIFATMLELPLFVLSVWIAMMANSMLHSIGDIFGKKIILGMLANNKSASSMDFGKNFAEMNFEVTNTLKIYFFDGFIEVAIAVFSIFIIYKIIISLHTTILDLIEVKGSQALDSAVESMKSEASSWKEMENYFKGEVNALKQNIDILAKKMSKGKLSIVAINMAGELLSTLLLIKNKIENRTISQERLLIVIQRLPLLYMQIPKIT